MKEKSISLDVKIISDDLEKLKEIARIKNKTLSQLMRDRTLKLSPVAENLIKKIHEKIKNAPN